MRLLVHTLIVTVLFTSSGCRFLRGAKPSGKDPFNDANSDNVSDEFGFVGREGRGHRPRDKESDGLTKSLSSPESRAILRNLGVD